MTIIKEEKRSRILVNIALFQQHARKITFIKNKNINFKDLEKFFLWVNYSFKKALTRTFSDEQKIRLLKLYKTEN